MKNFYKRGMLIIMFLLAMALLVILALGEANAATTSFTSPNIFQQQISGTVTGPNGQPLLGVTVFRKNSRVGATTNTDGYYSITANTQDTLVFSFIGFKSQEIPVGNHTILDISLEEDIASLGEVQINAGYYNTTRRESTGNISRVTAEEIENQPVVSPIQALQGRVAGVEIISGGSHPGMAGTIRIRGVNSLREEGNYPLYIIDGVPISSVPVESNTLLASSGIDPLNNLNPANIKSIEVLKDADATAIYGSRGANGVVLITTKTGNIAGTGFEGRFYKGVSTVPRRLDLLNTQDYLQIRREAFENDGVEPTERNAYDLLLWDQNRYTDWQDFAFGGNAEVTSLNLAFSGGAENTTFRLGGSYFSQGTVYPADYNYRKLTGNFNLIHASRDQKFNISASLNYGLDKNDLAGNLNLGSAIYLLPPNAPDLLNSDRGLNWEEWGQAGLLNPLEGFFNTSNTRTNSLIANTSLSYELFDGFKLKTSLGYTNANTEEFRKLPARSYNPAGNPINRSSHLDTYRTSWIIEPQLLYNSSWGKFDGNFILGATLQENKASAQGLQGTGYASEALIGNLAAAESILNARSTGSQYRYAALFSRLGFNWDKKYFLNLTGRRDGSSRFGPNNRFASFGAIGTAWIFSEESFIKSALPFLSFGKLRGSYGTTGNDQIGDYGYLDTYGATRGPGGLYPTSLANPDYSWEVNKKLEAALELAFLKDRINVGVSWYRNRSSNQLVGYPLPATTGFNVVQANLPATVENRGLEIELNTFNVQKSNFSWRSSLNVSFPTNELISYPELEQSSYANVYREGYPLNIALNYEYSGIDSETGLYTFRDVNEDGRLNTDDRIIVDNRTRSFYGGLNNELRLKSFSLQFLWEFVKQPGRIVFYNAGQPRNILNYNSYQRYSRSSAAGIAFSNAVNSSLFNQDASYLRLKNLSFSYNLSNKILGELGIDHGRIFIHGQNLLTITPYDGLDPESPNGGASFANLQTLTAGIELKL